MSPMAHPAILPNLAWLCISVAVRNQSLPEGLGPFPAAPKGEEGARGGSWQPQKQTGSSLVLPP
jgi:hypothetical protein